MNERKKITNRLATILLWVGFGFAMIAAAALFTPLDAWLEAPLAHREAPQSTDVIIVLGGGVVADLKILPWAVQERVQRGVELYEQGYSTAMIVTGGQVKGRTYTESDFLRQYAEFLGVPSEAVFEEAEATSTYENATFSKKIMDQHGWQTALLVTSAYHSGRACAVFKKLDMVVTCVAADRAAGWQDNAYRNLMDFRGIVREYGAVVYYWLRGYI